MRANKIGRVNRRPTCSLKAVRRSDQTAEREEDR
jgi:hypothetical protein